MDAYGTYLEGNELFREKKYKEAAEAFILSNSKDEHFKTYERLAECYLHMGLTQKALECYEKGYRLNSRNDVLCCKYAECLLKYTEKREYAAKLLKNTLERNASCKKAQVLMDRIEPDK